MSALSDNLNCEIRYDRHSKSILVKAFDAPMMV